MSGAGAQERGSDSQSEQASSPVRVLVEDEVVQVVSMSGEMEVLRHFSRSTTLMDMTAAAGTSALPITHSGIKLWQQAADSMLNTETWHLHRTLELSLVVQVCPKVTVFGERWQYTTLSQHPVLKLACLSTLEFPRCVCMQVSEYLNDKETLDWAIRRIAQAVDSAVRAKYRALYNQRDNGDASFWRQLLRPLEIGSGVLKLCTIQQHTTSTTCFDVHSR